MLYSKFSDCDNEFIEQLPAKVEIMDTNIGELHLISRFFLEFFKSIWLTLLGRRFIFDKFFIVLLINVVFIKHTCKKC